jgi:hypothetical protein
MCTPHGELIYASDPQQSASDQKHWNNLNLRLRFVDKDYAVMGHSGFTLNLKNTAADQRIKGYTPIKKKKTRKEVKRRSHIIERSHQSELLLKTS